MSLVIDSFLPERDTIAVGSFLTAKDRTRLQLCINAIRAHAATALCLLNGSTAAGIGIAHLGNWQEMDWDEDTASLMDGSSCYLENIELAPAFRRQGHGKRLLQALESTCCHSDKRDIFLHTSNADVFQFYEHCGYHHVRTVYPPWRQGRPVRIYGKVLLRGTDPGSLQ